MIDISSWSTETKTPLLDRKIEETAADLPLAYTKKLYLIYSENKNNAKDIISNRGIKNGEISIPGMLLSFLHIEGDLSHTSILYYYIIIAHQNI